MKTLLHWIPFLVLTAIIVWMIWEHCNLRIKLSEYRVDMFEAKRRLLGEQSLHAQTQEQYNSEKAWFLLTRDVPQKVSGCMADEEIREGVTMARNIMWKNTELRNLTRLELVAVIAYISKPRDDMRGFNTCLGSGLGQGSMMPGAVSPPHNHYYGGPLNSINPNGQALAQSCSSNQLSELYDEHQKEIARLMGRM